MNYKKIFFLTQSILATFLHKNVLLKFESWRSTVRTKSSENNISTWLTVSHLPHTLIHFSEVNISISSSSKQLLHEVHQNEVNEQIKHSLSWAKYIPVIFQIFLLWDGEAVSMVILKKDFFSFVLWNIVTDYVD